MEIKTINRINRLHMENQGITERPFQRLYVNFLGPYCDSKGNTVMFLLLENFLKYIFV